MKRSPKNCAGSTEHHGGKKVRKQEGAGGQLKVLSLGNNRVQVIIDDMGKLWIPRDDILQAMNLSSIPHDISERCARKNLFRILSDVSVRDRPALPATTSLIALEGVQMIERKSGQPKDKRFIESILGLLNGVATVAEESAEDNSSAAPAAEEIERLRRENEEQRAELKRQAEAKRRDDRHREALENCVYNILYRGPTEVVYIATTELYAAENIFKVGGVKGVDRLKSRLSTMNTGRTGNDSLFYCFWVKCPNHNRLEQRIADVIGHHRDRRQQDNRDRFNEMYKLHFDDLREVIEYLSDRSNEEDSKYKGSWDSFVQNLKDKPPAKVPVWTPNGAEDRSSKEKEGSKCKIGGFLLDWDSLEEAQRWERVEELFDEYIQTVTTERPSSAGTAGPVGLTRRDFEVYLIRQNIKFHKRSMWKMLKIVALSRSIPVKY